MENGPCDELQLLVSGGMKKEEPAGIEPTTLSYQPSTED